MNKNLDALHPTQHPLEVLGVDFMASSLKSPSGIRDYVYCSAINALLEKDHHDEAFILAIRVNYRSRGSSRKDCLGHRHLRKPDAPLTREQIRQQLHFDGLPHDGQ